jgi:hypothetical protein
MVHVGLVKVARSKHVVQTVSATIRVQMVRCYSVSTIVNGVVES